jgi:two-component system nitrate/nitrite response regulator NarL
MINVMSRSMLYQEGLLNMFGNLDAEQLLLLDIDSYTLAEGRAKFPEAKIIAISARVCAAEQVLRCLLDGAQAYLTHPTQMVTLRTIELVLAGGGPVVPAQLLAIMPLLQVPPPIDPLSPPRSPHVLSKTEHRVAKLVMEGLSNKAIADALGIADATVKVHMKNMLSKLQLANRTMLALWYQTQQVMAA